MKYFSASLMFRSIHSLPDPERPEFWEESIVLIQADTEAAAAATADFIARGRELSYRGEDEDQITLQFVKVERVHAIETAELQSGTELFSRTLRASEALSLMTPFDK
jgi:Domain of unknown function (DUF4288)